ncbi:MAG: hypothetical protein EHM23_01380, partial [Acidobacteria bacterium]
MRRLLLASGASTCCLAIALTTASEVMVPGPAAERSKSVIGAKVYEYKGDFDRLFNHWSGMGINTIWASEALVRAPGFREAAKRRRLSVYIIAPIFFNPAVLARQPELWAITGYGERARDEWVEFVCPSRTDYRQSRVEWIKGMVREVEPDGISIDFIRHFIFWEKVPPDAKLDPLRSSCFCPHCLQAFQASEQVTIPRNLATTREQAQWIVASHLTEWSNWKCRTITSVVETIAREARVVSPDIKLVVHLVPWREKDFNGAWKTIVGQDVRSLAKLVDVLSPM